MSSEYKIVVMGGGAVGKSALTVQMVQNHFICAYDPTIEDSYRKQTVIDDETCLLDILDTAGQEEFSCMRDQYMRNAQGFLLVYSIADRASFAELALFHRQILRVREAEIEEGKKIPMLICGNKSDLSTEGKREVSIEEGRGLAQQYNCPFVESSAKQRLNVEQSFFDLIREIRKAREPPKAPATKFSQKVKSKFVKNKNACKDKCIVC